MNRVDVVYELLAAADPVADVETLDSSALVARVEAALGYRATRVTSEHIVPRRRSLRPAWAAAIAFVATVAVLGGSLVLGVLLHQPGFDTASSWIPDGLEAAAAATSVGWLLVPTIATAVAATTALVVRNRTKETAMATTIDTPPAERLETARRNNRWLVAAVIVLALLLAALGAWVLYDLASEPETAATEEVQAVLDDYMAAYVDGDVEAFKALTTDNYRFESTGNYAVDRNYQGGIAVEPGFQIERVGNLRMAGDGPMYYVVATEQATLDDTVYPGVSAYVVLETDEGLRVLEHTWYSDL